MKNRRDVCYAKDAGFIQFDGLPGLIKTGCTSTPAFKSHYCSHHINQVCELKGSEFIDDDEMDKPTGPVLRSHSSKQSTESAVAEMILAKKTTRKQTYYQVCSYRHTYVYFSKNLSLHLCTIYVATYV